MIISMQDLERTVVRHHVRGEQAMLSIGRGLMSESKLLLTDEPSHYRYMLMQGRVLQRARCTNCATMKRRKGLLRLKR